MAYWHHLEESCELIFLEGSLLIENGEGYGADLGGAECVGEIEEGVLGLEEEGVWVGWEVESVIGFTEGGDERNGSGEVVIVVEKIALGCF